MVVGTLRSYADTPGSSRIAASPAIVALPADVPVGQASGPRSVRRPQTEASVQPQAQSQVQAQSQADLAPLQPPGGSMDPTAFRATAVVALAQLVMTRNFNGPVRTATAQELLLQARMALGRGESSLASDLAGLASRVMAPQGFDGTGRQMGHRPTEVVAEMMQDGGDAPESEPAPPVQDTLRGLAPLTLRESGVEFQPPPAMPRAQAPRLATDGTPIGIPRT